MTLNKEDLEFLDRIGVDDRRMKIITENQEDAVKYELMMTPTAKDMEKALQIVERLKKRIKWTRLMIDNEKDKERNMLFQWLLEHLISLENGEHDDEFQKILGEGYKIIDNPKWKTSCQDNGEENEKA